MDYQASVKTYGNTDRPEGTEDRPLVTFAVFAYNQEKYIREAVEGAFSQTYQPLEIILSDDCSQDGTFEIMKELTQQYTGPHTVKVERTPENLGIINHVFYRARQAQGEILVAAAGDDISHPKRCEVHLSAYNDPAVFGVTTGFNLIDACGKIVEANVFEPVIKTSYYEQTHLFHNLEHPYIVIQGSTASYRRKLFDIELPGKRLNFAEDNFMNFVIYALGHRVALIEESLVNYRTHSAAVANKKVSHKDASTEELAQRSFALDQQEKLDMFINVAKQIQDSGRINYESLRSQRSKVQLIDDWPEWSLVSRLKSTFVSVLSGDLWAIRWKVVRLFGQFPRYQPRIVMKKFTNPFVSRPKASPSK